MKVNTLKNRIAISLKKMKALSKNKFSHYSIDNIHSFRIKVKQLKAFLRFIQVENKNAIRLPKQIRELYKLLGQVRTQQLQQLSIRKTIKQINLPAPETYISHLHDETARNIKGINKLLKKKDLFSKLEFVNKLPNKISRVSLNKYLASQKEKLLILISTENPDDNKIHQIRKLFKELLYIFPYIIEKNTNSEKLSLAKEHLKLITDKLGTFHDTCLSIKLLSPEYIKRIASSKERKLLQKISKQFQRQKEESRSTIIPEEYRAFVNQQP